MAWLSSPRIVMHRILWFSDLREGDDSPLRTSFFPAVARHLPYPIVTDPAAPPWRTQRHMPNSVATMRCRLIPALVKNMPRCPCCNTSFVKYRRGKFMMQ
jgi:hypothetical protein